jgi:Protein of unknown function (DUF2934)
LDGLFCERAEKFIAVRQKDSLPRLDSAEAFRRRDQKERKEMDQNPSNKTQSSMQAAKPGSTREIAQSDIQVRAYQIYVSRNRQPGRDLDDWLQAERELLSRN